MGSMERAVPEKRALDLLRRYVRRTIYDGGLYQDVEQGISLGCPLSPLMGAFYLKSPDERVDKTVLAYARFMALQDDTLALIDFIEPVFGCLAKYNDANRSATMFQP